MRERRFVGCEGAVGRQRGAGFDHSRLGKANVVFVEFDGVGDPEGGGVVQQRVDAREVEIAGAGGGEVDVAHGRERDADQQIEVGA